MKNQFSEDEVGEYLCDLERSEIHLEPNTGKTNYRDRCTWLHQNESSEKIFLGEKRQATDWERLAKNKQTKNQRSLIQNR